MFGSMVLRSDHSNTRWLQDMTVKELSAHTDVPDHHAVGMVVDDDALVRESVAQVLEDLCAQVYQAADGQEGLEILEQHPDISVIVTDIAMPRLDGIAFASKARRLHPELKVLFVSGMQRPPGSEEFLAKPFRAIALVSALNQLMNVH
jgi:CheY-like chemotaxis protein